MNIKTELRKALLVEAEKKTIKRIWLSNDILDVNKKNHGKNYKI
jgi:hypothetical protein